MSCRLITPLFLMLLGIAGCKGTSEISSVKDGVLDIDKGLTVGKAIDNYAFFKSTQWNLVTTANGRKVVQATGIIDVDKHPTINPKNGTRSAYLRFEFQINQDTTFETAWCGVGTTDIEGNVAEPDGTIEISKCVNSLRAIYKNEPNF